MSDILFFCLKIIAMAGVIYWLLGVVCRSLCFGRSMPFEIDFNTASENLRLISEQCRNGTADKISADFYAALIRVLPLCDPAPSGIGIASMGVDRQFACATVNRAGREMIIYYSDSVDLMTSREILGIIAHELAHMKTVILQHWIYVLTGIERVTAIEIYTDKIAAKMVGADVMTECLDKLVLLDMQQGIPCGSEMSERLRLMSAMAGNFPNVNVLCHCQATPKREK